MSKKFVMKIVKYYLYLQVTKFIKKKFSINNRFKLFKILRNMKIDV